MSYAIDVNLLLYASDADAPRHVAALHFLREIAGRKELMGIPYPVALGYLRIATHPRIFRHPLTPEEAMQNLESIAALPHVRFLSEREGFFDDYREITAAVSARGNLVPDAHTATILRQHDIRVLYTADRDFRRFEFLDVRDPFTPAAGR
jgi:toxin-antitoxin system PIN domain toxin